MPPRLLFRRLQNKLRISSLLSGRWTQKLFSIPSTIASSPTSVDLKRRRSSQTWNAANSFFCKNVGNFHRLRFAKANRFESRIMIGHDVSPMEMMSHMKTVLSGVRGQWRRTIVAHPSITNIGYLAQVPPTREPRRLGP